MGFVETRRQEEGTMTGVEDKGCGWWAAMGEARCFTGRLLGARGGHLVE